MANLSTHEVKEVAPKAVTGDRMTVSIPAEDLYEQPHPGVQLIGGAPKVWKDEKWVSTGEGGTHLRFEAGKTYDVPKVVGEQVLERLKIFDREQRRLMNPRADRRSINQVTAGSNWTRGGGGNVTDMDKGWDSVAGSGEQVITVDF